ncbi:MAG: luciferase family protein [Oligoflexales bacterium]
MKKTLREKLTDGLLAAGLKEQKSRFGGGPAFYLGKKEVAHFHNENEIDIRLTKKVIKEVLPDLEEAYKCHQRTASSDWLEFQFWKDHDVERAVALVRDVVQKERARER